MSSGKASFDHLELLDDQKEKLCDRQRNPIFKVGGTGLEPVTPCL